MCSMGFTDLMALTWAALPENNEASAELTTANGGTLLRAQPDSVANNIADRLISVRRLACSATETG